MRFFRSSLFVVGIIPVLLPCLRGQQNIQCDKLTSCSCQSSQGTIDLSPLDSKDPNNPKWMDQWGSSYSYQYSYNPCSDFTEGTMDCSSVAACQIDMSSSSYWSLGPQSSASFVTDPQLGLTIQYTGTGSDSVTRTAIVQLLCDPTKEGDFQAQGEQSGTNYQMTLTSKHCCPTGGGQVTVTVSISVGTVLCIILIVTIPLYIIGGIVFNKVKRGATGVEVLPNVTFWKDFPFLVKDGFVFVVQGVKSKTTGYQEM